MTADGDIGKQLPTWRLWGEEKVDGAVYAVYLKKVRYHSPSKSIGDSDDNISHLEWETVRFRFIKSGTLERLVESLCSDAGELESSYVNIFLATYRTFSTASQVMGLISKRYQDLNTLMPEATRLQHQKVLRSALYVWLDAFTEDFNDPPDYPLLQQLEAFAQQQAKDNASELLIKIKYLKDKLIAANESSSSSSSSHQLSPWLQRTNAPAGHLNSNEESPHSPSSNSSEFLSSWKSFAELSERHIAEQLTRLDTVLFKRVVPHQCLGAVWSRRGHGGERGQEAVSTVAATVDQFNAVSHRVISTVLHGTQNQPDSILHRPKIIAKWIDIAQELRVLKNFSSLKAIISALQSNSIYRLKHAWSCVAKDKVEVFDELARIFNEDNNQSAQRDLLNKEGTAKYAQSVGTNDRHLQKVINKQSSNSTISHGTIPYLGTFLTDLTMIDTAIPDCTANGLINFDKRRKEFEVLATIKLLQGAAKSYSLATDVHFERLFGQLPVLDERDAYEWSCRIEPRTSDTSTSSSASLMGNNNSLSDKSRRKRYQLTPTPIGGGVNGGSSAPSPSSLGHRKNDSIASTASSSSGSQFLSEVDGASHAHLHDVTSSSSLDHKVFSVRLSSSSSSSSLPSLDVSISSSGVGGAYAPQATPTTTSSNHSSKAGSLPRGLTPPLLNGSANPSPMRTADFYVIRVSLASPYQEQETVGVNLYKSIMVGVNEKTPQVIRNAMLKHALEGNPDDYLLAQILPKNVEMVLPMNANVYYAVNTSCDLNFILRRRSQQPQPMSDTPPLTTPLRPRLSHDSSNKDALKARKKILSLGN